MQDSNLVEKICCPFHDDVIDSCAIYSDSHYYCYGCGAHGDVNELNYTLDKKNVAPTIPDNIDQALFEIKKLPLKLVRGLLLPCNHDGFYIVWPNAPYYIKRVTTESAYASKYLCPKGHQRPLFIAKDHQKGSLIVVEGELNALSIATACPDLSVCSPGSAGEFRAKKMYRYLPFFQQFDNVTLVVDNDAAGAIAGIELKDALKKERILVKPIRLWDEDANEVLVKYGKDELYKRTMESIDGKRKVSLRVRCD